MSYFSKCIFYSSYTSVSYYLRKKESGHECCYSGKCCIDGNCVKDIIKRNKLTCELVYQSYLAIHVVPYIIFGRFVSYHILIHKLQ